MEKVARVSIGVVVAVLALLALVAFWAIREEAPKSSATDATRQQSNRSSEMLRYTIPANPIALQPSAGRKVAGIVVEGDRPVEGATVTVQLLNQAEVAATATTGPDGRFDLGAIKWPSAHLAVQAEGYVTEYDDLALADSALDAQNLRIELKSCEPGEKWTVVDSTQQPIANAFIVTHAPTSKGPRSGGYQRIATQAIAPSGEFYLCKKAYAWVYSVEASGFGTYWIGGGDSVRGGLAVLARGGTLEGVVMDSEGRPVEDVRVESRWKAFGMPANVAGAGSIAFTGADGHFVIRDLRPGGYDLRATQPQAFPPMYKHNERFAEAIVNAGATTVVSLTVETRFAVSGVVREDGTPEPGADLWIENCDRTFSHEDGIFSTQCTPSDLERRIFVRHHDTLEESIPPLHGPTADLLIDVVATPSVHGRVLLERRPVTNVAVGKDRAFGRSDKDGNYRLWFPAGKRIVEAWDFERNLRSGVYEIDLKEGADIKLDLELKPRGRIRGRVVDQNGAPATYATVELDGERSGRPVDPEGKFEFSLLDFEEHVIGVETQWDDGYNGREVKERVTLSANTNGEPQHEAPEGNRFLRGRYTCGGCFGERCHGEAEFTQSSRSNRCGRALRPHNALRRKL